MLQRSWLLCSLPPPLTLPEEPEGTAGQETPLKFKSIRKDYGV